MKGLASAWMPSMSHWIVQLIITFSAFIAQSVDIALFLAHEAFNAIIGTEGSPAIRPSRSAVLILGTEDDGNLALEFSKLGFTVFVVSRRPSASSSSHDLSSLLYHWHHLKERSPRSAWGLIAPINMDPRSKLDRSKAYETVHAYCFEHSLGLIGLIDLPHRRDERDEIATPLTTSSTSTSSSERVSPEYTLSNGAPLREVIYNDITLPCLIAQDYLSLLSRSSGRLIVVSGVAESNWFHFRASMRLRRATSQILRDRLHPLGINVTLITSSPLQRSLMTGGQSQDLKNISPRSPGRPSGTRREPRRHIYSGPSGADTISHKNWGTAWNALSTTTVGDLVVLTKQVLYAR
ncbi:hypothetical protein HGRIS_013528 [Hohenbuehelia grisea]